MNPQLVQASDIQSGDIIAYLGKVREVHCTADEITLTIDWVGAFPVRLHPDAEVWVSREWWWAA